MKHNVTLAVGLGLVAAGMLHGPGHAASVVGGTDLLTEPRLAQLEAWLTGDPTLSYDAPLVFTNIFDKAPGDTGSDFHAAADGEGPTVSVMEATHEDGGGLQIVGGFNPVSWTSDDEYTVSPVATEAARTSFIFNLTSGERRDQRIDDFVGRYGAYNRNRYGPTFGQGHDLVVTDALETGYAYTFSYCVDPVIGCVGGTSPAILGLPYSGQTSVAFGAIEVFTISEGEAVVPLPAALPLYGATLGVIGGVAALRRRVRA